MGTLRPWHVAILVVVMLMLFGAKRLPDTARSLGRSLRILKAETRGLEEDEIQAQAATASRSALDAGTAPEVRPSPRPVVEPVRILPD